MLKNQMNILKKKIKLLITLFILLGMPINFNLAYSAGNVDADSGKATLYNSGKKLVLRAKKLENF